MYESKNQPLLSLPHFTRRLFLHILLAFGVMAITLLIGVLAHVWFEGVSWHDALLNTALIVGGIGPYFIPDTVGGKLFFAFYSMFVGLMFVTTLGIILAPLAHRILHKFHLDDE